MFFSDQAVSKSVPRQGFNVLSMLFLLPSIWVLWLASSFRAQDGDIQTDSGQLSAILLSLSVLFCLAKNKSSSLISGAAMLLPMLSTAEALDDKTLLECLYRNKVPDRVGDVAEHHYGITHGAKKMESTTVLDVCVCQPNGKAFVSVCLPDHLSFGVSHAEGMFAASTALYSRLSYKGFDFSQPAHVIMTCSNAPCTNCHSGPMQAIRDSFSPGSEIDFIPGAITDAYNFDNYGLTRPDIGPGHDPAVGFRVHGKDTYYTTLQIIRIDSQSGNANQVSWDSSETKKKAKFEVDSDSDFREKSGKPSALLFKQIEGDAAKSLSRHLRASQGKVEEVKEEYHQTASM